MAEQKAQGSLFRPSETQLAYLAGVVDSDGYITINESRRKGAIYHAPQVGITGTRPQPHHLAASFWGGKVSVYHPKLTGHRPQFQWSRQGGAAACIIAALLPYLLVKSDQALTALELWQHIEDGRSEDAFPWFGASYDPVAERCELRQQMIALNQSRSRLRGGRTSNGDICYAQVEAL